MKINSLHFFSLLSLVVFPGCWSREKPHGLNNQCHKTLVSDTHSYSHRTHSHVRSRCTVVAASHAGDMSLFYHAVHNLGICQKICPCWSFFFLFLFPSLAAKEQKDLRKSRNTKSSVYHKPHELGPAWCQSTTQHYSRRGEWMSYSRLQAGLRKRLLNTDTVYDSLTRTGILLQIKLYRRGLFSVRCEEWCVEVCILWEISMKEYL